MFLNQTSFGDFKENVKNIAPGKSSIYNPKKGLKSRSLNSFNSSSDVLHNKKTGFGVKNGDLNTLSNEKENLKTKIKVPDIKVEIHTEEDSWSDIEEMHISIEPDDDYEDILPKYEQIQRKDIDSLFFNYTSPELIELTVDRLPSPLKEDQSICIPEFSPVIPDINHLLYGDTELDFIPLPFD